MLSSAIICTIREQLKRNPEKLIFKIPRKWIEGALKEYLDLEQKYVELVNKTMDNEEE